MQQLSKTNNPESALSFSRMIDLINRLLHKIQLCEQYSQSKPYFDILMKIHGTVSHILFVEERELPIPLDIFRYDCERLDDEWTRCYLFVKIKLGCYSILPDKSKCPITSSDNYFKGYSHAEEALLSYVKINPHDTNAWLLLMRIECNSPLEDPFYITNYAKTVLAYDNHNAYALLFLAYAQYYMLGGIDSETYTLLCAAHDPNPEIMAMIEIAKAHYWENKEESGNFVEALQKSISYSQQQAFNYIYLGKWYISNGNSDLGKEFIKKGLHNVKKITTFDDNPDGYDPLSIIDLFNEFYTGTQMSEPLYGAALSLVLE